MDYFPGTSMRLGLLSQWYEPEPAPIPSVLARVLSSHGHSVRVLTGFPNYPFGRLYDGYRIRWKSDSVLDHGISVRRVALYPSHTASVAGRLANYLSFATTASVFGSGFFNGIDAVWVSNSPPTVGLPTSIIKGRYRPRIVLHIMDLWPESLSASTFGSILNGPGLSKALDIWLSATYHAADAVACSSRTQMDRLMARGVPTSKLSYVPIWVDEELFQPIQRDIELAVQLGVADKVVLLYVGALGEPQGLDPLIEVCSRFGENSKFHCLIAGTGLAEVRLRQRAEELRLTNVSFLGRWPLEDITRLMSIGDVHFVSLRPDPLAEVAMPSKLPATLACAKPVIVAARGEAAAVVARSGAGWVCAPGDVDDLQQAIEEALAAGDTKLRIIGQKAHAAYKAEFAVETGTRRIERLLAGRSSAGADAA